MYDAYDIPVLIVLIGATSHWLYKCQYLLPKSFHDDKLHEAFQALHQRAPEMEAHGVLAWQDGHDETGVIVHCGAKLELMGIVVTFWAIVCRGSELKSKTNCMGNEKCVI